jgi:tetratricopeptide (TPR) repeat protein
VPGQLEALAYRDFVRPTAASFAGEVAFRFKHILVREAAYQSTAKRLRAALHAQFADWLEGYARERIGEYEEILGYHLEQAYRYRTEVGLLDQATDALRDRAASVLVAAGRRAADRGDYHAAGNLFERALTAGIGDQGIRVAIKAELGNVLKETDRLSDGDALLREAHDEAQGIGEHRTAALALVYRHTTVRDPNSDLEEMANVLTQAVETFSDFGDERGLALARRQLGMSLNRLDRRAEGMRELEHAIVHADASGDVAVRRRVIGTYVGQLNRASPMPVIEAIERCEELLATAKADRVLEAVLKRFLGSFFAMAGRPDEALALFVESSLVLDELNHLVYSMMYRAAAARGRELAGDPIGAEQERLAEYNYFKGLAYNGPYAQGISAAYALADYYCNQGRWGEAERIVAPYREFPLNTQNTVALATRRLALEARVAAHDGRIEEALSLAAQLVERVRARGVDRERPDEVAAHWLAIAEVERAAGHAAEAEAARETALELYRLRGNVAAADRVLAATT